MCVYVGFVMCGCVYVWVLCVCMCGLCNVWVCVCVGNVWVCVCVGIVMCGRVYVWVLCVCIVMCGVCMCEFCVRVCVYVWVL